MTTGNWTRKQWAFSLTEDKHEGIFLRPTKQSSHSQYTPPMPSITGTAPVPRYSENGDKGMRKWASKP